MDIFFYFVATGVALFLVAVIAFPQIIVPAEITTTKTVGPTYWGSYTGQSVEDNADEKKIKVSATRKKQLIVAGSATYAAGRGVKMSG
jgi:hypothetical protein